MVTGGFFVAAWSPIMVLIYLLAFYGAIQAYKHPDMNGDPHEPS